MVYMNYFEKKELNTLKGEIIARDAAIEAAKYSFERELKNGLSDEIIRTLNNPPKPNFWNKIKLMFNRWALKRKELKELKEYKKLMKDLE